MDAVLTTWPSSCCSSNGTNDRTPCTTPQKFTPTTHCQSARLASQTEAPLVSATPALLHTTCTAPNVSSVVSANRWTSSARDTSQRTPTTSAPPERKRCSATASTPSSTSARTTFIPSAANRSASPKPMPLAPPV